MLYKLLKFLFTKAIGHPNISPEQKEELMDGFTKLLSEVAKSAAEGAVKGAKK